MWRPLCRGGQVSVCEEFEVLFGRGVGSCSWGASGVGPRTLSVYMKVGPPPRIPEGELRPESSCPAAGSLSLICEMV